MLYRSFVAAADYRAALELAAAVCGVPPAAVMRPRRRSSGPGHARRIGVYLAVTGTNWTRGDIARVAGVSRQAVSRICAEVEAMRDDPVLDAALANLETEVAP